MCVCVCARQAEAANTTHLGGHMCGSNLHMVVLSCGWLILL